jgi:hypothetical protein
VDVYSIGWRPTRKYLIHQYGFQEDDFELASEQSGGDSFPGFNQIIPDQKHPEGCPCGCGDVKKKKSFSRKLVRLFASKEEKELVKDTEQMERFDTAMLKAAQQETNETVDVFIDALGQVNDYGEAFEALASAYSRTSPKRCAALLDEIRYASSQIGARTGQGGRRA